MFLRTVRFVLPAVALAAALAPQTAVAYMALLRQGVESAEVPNAFDHYGDRIVTGDFNGDGFQDIAVAASDENNDIGVSGQHGVVIVSYGSEFGITHLGADVLSIGAPNDFNVNFGRGLAAGDFNGDGVDDLAVGAPGADNVTSADVGTVMVYKGLAGVGISLAPYITLDQADCGTTVESGDQFGYTLCAGDMGGDGYADLFVGSIGEDSSAGLVGFFPGSDDGITPTGSGFAKQSSLGGVDDAGALFGYSLAIGDFIGDNYLDLAIGAPYGDDGSLLNVGKVYIVRGTAAGPVVTGGQILTPLSLSVGVQPGGTFGWSLAAGSFLDADGSRPDLAIGEPLYNLPGAPAAGRVVVVDYDGPGDNIHVPPRILDQTTIGVQAVAGAAFGWALAAGNIMDNNGIAGPDNLADLAIGAPNSDVLVPGSTEAIYWDGVGTAYIVPGSHSNFALTHVKVLDAMERNDLWFSFGEKMGWSLCFGKFDDTGWDNLAIGVPEKNYPAFIDNDTEQVEAGQVYIMAPWRQPAGRPHRSSVVQDCANRILYAQRMNQRLTPASTTKALTALIAAEAIQNQDVDPEQLYTIPDWVAHKVTGSQYGLFAGEQISFKDLVRTMIAVSGNDCAYAIGNILTGEDNDWDYGESTAWNLEHILADFAVVMNARTSQMGVSPAHYFNNPAGRPYGEHWTNAVDMAIFVDAAMDNPLFREFVGTKTWNDIYRVVPFNGIFPWLPPSSVFLPVYMSVSNGFFDGIEDRDPRARGVKGGSNGVSLKTGLYAAEIVNGYAKVTVFGVPSYGALADLGAELLSLVGTDCEPAQVVPQFGNPFPFADARRLDSPLDQDRVFGASAQLDPEQTDDLCVEIFRNAQTTPTTCLTTVINRRTAFDLDDGEVRGFDLAASGGNLRQIGLTIHNTHLTAPARFNVSSVALDLDLDIALPPDGIWIMPTPTFKDVVDQQDFQIWNTGNRSELEVEQVYGFELTLGDDRTTPPDWKVDLTRDGIFRSDYVDATVVGCGPADGNTVDISLHSVLATSAVDDGNGAIPARLPGIHGLDIHPNPFNPMTTVAFDLDRDATVSLRVYNLSGRLVRVLEVGRALSTGHHQVTWDGRDDSGRTMASGVYIVRANDGLTALTKRMTLLK